MLKHISPGVRIAIGLALIYSAYFSLTTVLNYRMFWYGGMDLAENAHGMWLAARFDSMFSTIRGMNYWGDHLWLLIVVLIPIYKLAPSIETLLILQSVALAAGAVPLAALAYRKTGHTWMAAVLAAAWLLSPALQNMNLENYHPEIYATPLLMWAIERADAQKWRGYWILIALAVLAKEDVALTVIGLGLYLFVAKHRRVGMFTMAFGVGWFLNSMLVLLPYFNDYGFFRTEGGHPFSAWWSNLFNPTYYADVFAGPQARQYVRQLFGPVAFLALLAPEVLLGLLPSFLINVGSGNHYLASINYHYNNQTLPFLYAAVAIGLGRLAKSKGGAFAINITSQPAGSDAIAARQVKLPVPQHVGPFAAKVLTGVLLWAALVGNMTLSQLPIQNSASRIAEQLNLIRTGPANRDFPEIQAIADASPELNISASYSLMAKMSYRDNIYMFPNPFQASLWGVNGENLPDPSIIDMLILEVSLVDGPYLELLHSLVETGKFRVTKRKGQFLVLEKNPTPIPPARPNVLTAAPPKTGIRMTAYHDPDRPVYRLGLLMGLVPAMEVQTNSIRIPRAAGPLALADGQKLPGADNTQIVFSGAWTAAGRAPVQFRMQSDDGCRIRIDGKVVADRDGVQRFDDVWTSEPMTLSPGSHHVVVEYFEWGGEAGLTIEWARPGTPFRPLTSGDLLP
jgi:uncharacterized membrane protein